ncbi:hypothetical protein D3C71_78050 [compost metagenome]
MYTLISAIGEPRNGQSRWTDIDIGDMTLSDIYAAYENVFAILSNSFLPDHVSLDLALIREQYGSLSITFDDFLAGLGNQALPTSDTLPELKTRYAKYADAFHAGYKLAPTHPVFSPDAQLPPSEMPWVHMTRPSTDYALFGRSCLVTVNGYYHPIEADASGIYVRDGNKSRVHSGHNQMGILSFRELGVIRQIPITEEMLYKPQGDDQMRYRAHLDVGEDISSKTVFLVLGGYLHTYDQQTFYRTGNTQLTIDFNNLPLFERYQESRKYLDYSSMPFERSQNNDSQIAVNDFLTDENLTAYLTLTQSFIVILDTPNIFVTKQDVHRTKGPGKFVAYTPPLYPLIVGHGRTADYWYEVEDGQYAVNVVDSFLHDWVFNKTDPFKQGNIGDSRVPETPVGHSPGYFLQIGRDI